MNIISENSNSWANYEPPRMATKRSHSENDQANEVNVSQNIESPEKPVRKRSRVSKKTPTTFLIANPSNFRALVQQSTGCQSSNCFKGPINLKFGASDDEEADIFSPDSSTSSMLGFSYYNNDKSFVEEKQHKKDILDQAQKNSYELESEESSSSSGDDFLPTLSPSPTPYSMAFDDLVIEDIFLEDLDGDFLSNALADEALFFYSY